MSNDPILEPAAQAFAEATANPPYLFDLGPTEGRKVVDDVQSPEIDVPGTEKETLTIPEGVSVNIFRPTGVDGPLPVVFFIHGAGWVFGNDHTHGRLARELALGARAAVVFPNYTLSPEARYPSATQENYAAAQWVVAHGAEHGLDSSRIAVAGDSVGGNMAASLTLTAKARGDVTLAGQVLFYPVTNADFDTSPTTSSPRATSCAATACNGSGTSTPPTPPSAPRSPPRPCGRASTNWPACHRRW
jgi:acetyl esterase/lipase